MADLVAGANLPLTGTAWKVSLKFPHSIQQDLGIAVLPVNEATQLLITPGFAHRKTTDWMSGELSTDGTLYTVSLDSARLPDSNVSRLLIVAYRYSARGSVSSAEHISLELDSACHYDIDLKNMEASALIVGEIYHRSGNWKFRALAETSAYGLTVLGHRLGMDLDDSSPYAPTHSEQPAENWTGTAFLVAPGVVLTNAHVVDGSGHTRLTSLQGAIEAEVIISDNNNDLALLRASIPPTITPLCFRQVGAGLAEPVTTLGYPLASLMGSSIQVTQGVISGLFGVQNDIRLLQFTAPIQPGSSGSPLLDPFGAVLGVVSASFTQSQNMNFAVRGILAMALMDAVNIQYALQTDTTNLSAPQMVSKLQNAIWKVECSR